MAAKWTCWKLPAFKNGSKINFPVECCQTRDWWLYWRLDTKTRSIVFSKSCDGIFFLFGCMRCILCAFLQLYCCWYTMGRVTFFYYVFSSYPPSKSIHDPANLNQPETVAWANNKVNTRHTVCVAITPLHLRNCIIKIDLGFKKNRERDRKNVLDTHFLYTIENLLLLSLLICMSGTI